MKISVIASGNGGQGGVDSSQTEQKNICAMAGTFPHIDVTRMPGNEELLQLADSLESAVSLKSQNEAGITDGTHKILQEFAAKFSPLKGAATYQTRDKKTMTICLGAPATEDTYGISATVKANTQWVIAVGGKGLDNNLGRLPRGGENMPSGLAGDAMAEAINGIAIAQGGDGMIIRSGSGIAGGGCGGDAEAISSVYGLAIGGKDRTGSMIPPNDGNAKGSGSYEEAKKLLRTHSDKKK
jgi:hypothetical protein